MARHGAAGSQPSGALLSCSAFGALLFLSAFGALLFLQRLRRGPGS